MLYDKAPVYAAGRLTAVMMAAGAALAGCTAPLDSGPDPIRPSLVSVSSPNNYRVTATTGPDGQIMQGDHIQMILKGLTHNDFVEIMRMPVDDDGTCSNSVIDVYTRAVVDGTPELGMIDVLMPKYGAPNIGRCAAIYVLGATVTGRVFLGELRQDGYVEGQDNRAWHIVPDAPAPTDTVSPNPSLSPASSVD